MDQKELTKKYAELRIYSQMEKIGHKHSLHIDQIGILDSETRAMIVGVTPREKFVSEVMNGLDISLGKAEAIVQDINTEIMIPLRESLKGNTSQIATTPAPLEEPPHPAVAIQDLENPTSTTSANILSRSLEQQLLSQPTSTPAVQQVSAIKSPSAAKIAPPRPPVPQAPSSSGRPVAPLPPGTVPKPPAAPVPPVKKPYTADPYREAIN